MLGDFRAGPQAPSGLRPPTVPASASARAPAFRHPYENSLPGVAASYGLKNHIAEVGSSR